MTETVRRIPKLQRAGDGESPVQVSFFRRSLPSRGIRTLARIYSNLIGNASIIADSGQTVGADGFPPLSEHIE